MDPWRYSTAGISVALRVTPRGGRDDIDGIETLADGRSVLKVRVRAIADGGEANRAVTGAAGEIARRAQGQGRLLSGATSRLKQIAVDGDPARLGEALRKLDIGEPNRQTKGTDMTAQIIDGKVIAAELRARVADEVARVKREHNLVPGLAVVLVGNDPASEVYVRSKHKQTQAAGMASFEHKLPADVSQADLLAVVAQAQPRSRRARHSGAAAAAEGPAHRGRHQRHRSRQGCRRPASEQCRPARRRL